MNANIITRGPYQRREAHYHHYKQEFSQELKAMMEYNTEANENSKRVKHFKTNYHAQEELILIDNAIDHPIIG